MVRTFQLLVTRDLPVDWKILVIRITCGVPLGGFCTRNLLHAYARNTEVEGYGRNWRHAPALLRVASCCCVSTTRSREEEPMTENVRMFTPEEVDKINKLTIFSRLGAMQGGVVPPRGTPMTYSGIAAAYEAQARYAATVFADVTWELLVDVWTPTDLDIVRDALTCVDDEHKEDILCKLWGWTEE